MCQMALDISPLRLRRACSTIPAHRRKHKPRPPQTAGTGLASESRRTLSMLRWSTTLDQFTDNRSYPCRTLAALLADTGDLERFAPRRHGVR